MTVRPLNKIAAEIKNDWVRINSPAESYLEAMTTLRSLQDHYGHDSAQEIVIRFLSVANTWRGETARRIKVELNDMVESHGKG